MGSSPEALLGRDSRVSSKTVRLRKVPSLVAMSDA